MLRATAHIYTTRLHEIGKRLKSQDIAESERKELSQRFCRIALYVFQQGYTLGTDKYGNEAVVPSELRLQFERSRLGAGYPSSL